MDEQLTKGKFLRGFIRWLCFIALGAALFIDQTDPFNWVRMVLGIVTVIIFGGIYKLKLKALLYVFNGKVRKEKGRHTVSYSVENGMLFLVPFAVMALIAAYYLRWSSVTPFLSTGLMVVGGASTVELSKFTGKSSIKNTLIASGVSFLFSFILILGMPYIANIPGMLEGLADLIPTVLGKGGGVQ